MPLSRRFARPAEGAEWLPGRDYDILGTLGGGEGRMSVVFRIRLRPPHPPSEYALKMVLHFVGETPGQRVSTWARPRGNCPSTVGG